jgi:hypothetical protein
VLIGATTCGNGAATIVIVIAAICSTIANRILTACHSARIRAHLTAIDCAIAIVVVAICVVVDVAIIVVVRRTLMLVRIIRAR